METDKHVIIVGVIILLLGAAIIWFWGWVLKLSQSLGRFLLQAVRKPEGRDGLEPHVSISELPSSAAVEQEKSPSFVEQRTVASSAPSVRKSPPLSTTLALSETEAQIVVLFARADGAAMYASEVAEGLGVSRLRTDQAIDSLIQRGLVRRILNYVEGTRVVLTPMGRDFVIDCGLV